MTVSAGTFIVAGNEDIAYVPVDAKENANLLAAAPDLLSALVMAKNWLDCDVDRKMCDHDQGIYDDIMESINQAINKATQ